MIIDKNQLNQSLTGGSLLQNLSDLFGTLSHPVRIKILRILYNNEQDVSHLQEILGITQSNVSQHLHALKQQGLVSDCRKGKHVFYSLKSPQVLQLLTCAVQLMALQLATDSELLSSCEELLSFLVNYSSFLFGFCFLMRYFYFWQVLGNYVSY